MAVVSCLWRHSVIHDVIIECEWWQRHEGCHWRHFYYLRKTLSLSSVFLRFYFISKNISRTCFCGRTLWRHNEVSLVQIKLSKALIRHLPDNGKYQTLALMSIKRKLRVCLKSFKELYKVLKISSSCYCIANRYHYACKFGNKYRCYHEIRKW